MRPLSYSYEQLEVFDQATWSGHEFWDLTRLKIIALQVVFGGKITIEHEMYFEKYTDPSKMSTFRF